MMNTIKFNVEEAIKAEWMNVSSIVLNYFIEKRYELDDESYELSEEEKIEVMKIIKNIRIQG